MDKWKKGELETETGSKPGTTSTNKHETAGKEAPDILKDNSKIGKEKPQKLGDYKKLYDAYRTKSKGYATKVDGKVSDKDKFTQFNFRGVDNTSNISTPIGDLIKDVERTEDEALEGKDLPPRYRELMKDYYKSLK
jgi:hypothetical protein